MKVLSLKQPWAQLVLERKKTIELRKWNTNFRGEFLIHSSKVPDHESMKKFGFENLPCGMILGKATLLDVKRYENEQELAKDAGKHLATPEWGKFGFLLTDVEKIEPISAKGSLNFWNYED